MGSWPGGAHDRLHDTTKVRLVEVVGDFAEHHQIERAGRPVVWNTTLLNLHVGLVSEPSFGLSQREGMMSLDNSCSQRVANS